MRSRSGLSTKVAFRASGPHACKWQLNNSISYLELHLFPYHSKLPYSIFQAVFGSCRSLPSKSLSSAWQSLFSARNPSTSVLAMFPVSSAGHLSMNDGYSGSHRIGWLPPSCLVIRCVRVRSGLGRCKPLCRQPPQRQLQRGACESKTAVGASMIA